MRFSDYRHKYPFIRLVVPLASGILLCEYFSDALNGMWQAGITILLLSLIFVFVSFLTNRYSCRWVWGVAVSLFFFSAGILLSAGSSEGIRLEDSTDFRVCFGRVSGSPQEKAKTILCPVTVEEYRDSLKSRRCNFRILLYLPKDSQSHQVVWGDRLEFCSRISPPRNPGNPDEFDYASYLLHHGVSGTSWAGAGRWKKISPDSLFDFRQKANDIRTKIMDFYRQAGFKGDELAVLSALTLGYKDDLSENVRQAFSVAGVSHVLALSGLHIGLIYALLLFSLGWIAKFRRLGWLTPLLIIASLWVYAFITGLSPSVVRSVFMFSLLALSGCFSGRSVTLNTLAVAAFFMLLYNPFYLFDVSFQLSFVSVAGIVLIQPWLYRKWVPANRFLNYLWGMATVTIAAQVVTSPLILYYFSGFPVHFLWVNLLAIPLVTLILYLAVCMLLTGWLPVIPLLIARLLEKLLGCLNAVTAFVEQLPLAFVKDFHLNGFYVPGVFISLLLIALFSASKKKFYLYACLSVVFILAVFHLQELVGRKVTPSIVFYNNRAAPCVHFISTGEHSYLLPAGYENVMVSMQRATSRYWMLHHISLPEILPDSYTGKYIANHRGIVTFAGKRICMVKDNRWQNKTTPQPLPVDILYVCKGFRGHISQLAKLFTIRRVVLDSSLSDYRLEMLKRECRACGIDFIAISEKGSYRIEL